MKFLAEVVIQSLLKMTGLSAGDLLMYDGTSLARLAPGTAGYLLASGGPSTALTYVPPVVPGSPFNPLGQWEPSDGEGYITYVVGDVVTNGLYTYYCITEHTPGEASFSSTLANWFILGLNSSLALIGQSDAEAGTETEAALWSSQRVAQAIAAQVTEGVAFNYPPVVWGAEGYDWEVGDLAFVASNPMTLMRCIAAHEYDAGDSPATPGASWEIFLTIPSILTIDQSTAEAGTNNIIQYAVTALRLDQAAKATLNRRLADQTLTPGATVTYDCATSVNATWTIGQDSTLSIPTNTRSGDSGSVVITQGGAGGWALTLPSGWGLSSGDVLDVAEMATGEICMLSWRRLTSTTFISALIMRP
jgi:hypothetical protein